MRRAKGDGPWVAKVVAGRRRGRQRERHAAAAAETKWPGEGPTGGTWRDLGDEPQTDAPDYRAIVRASVARRVAARRTVMGTLFGEVEEGMPVGSVGSCGDGPAWGEFGATLT